mmetsp:Transcript_3615/g.9387  ORF Transcript_3615/g.9387 Transcript_3615/m.9387 type:complete len:216 (-) Transcript_3615:85-732(-)
MRCISSPPEASSVTTYTCECDSYAAISRMMFGCFRSASMAISRARSSSDESVDSLSMILTAQSRPVSRCLHMRTAPYVPLPSTCPTSYSASKRSAPPLDVPLVGPADPSSSSSNLISVALPTDFHDESLSSIASCFSSASVRLTSSFAPAACMSAVAWSDGSAPRVGAAPESGRGVDLRARRAKPCVAPLGESVGLRCKLRMSGILAAIWPGLGS